MPSHPLPLDRRLTSAFGAGQQLAHHMDADANLDLREIRQQRQRRPLRPTRGFPQEIVMRQSIRYARLSCRGSSA